MMEPKKTGAVVLFTGLPASGKTTLGEALKAQLELRGRGSLQFDGDVVRDVLPPLDFTAESRLEQARRVSYSAALVERQGLIVIVSLILPYYRCRGFFNEWCRNVYVIYVATPLEECQRRDPKGLYAAAAAGQKTGVTGVDDPYEEPDRYWRIVLPIHWSETDIECWAKTTSGELLEELCKRP